MTTPITAGASVRRPVDIYSTDGHILTRGTFEVELADEGAGKSGVFYDPLDPNDQAYLTLNIYAVAPEHANGCGRVLLRNGSIVTMTHVRTEDDATKTLLERVADRLESVGLSPYRDHVLDDPDVTGVLVEFADLTASVF